MKMKKNDDMNNITFLKASRKKNVKKKKFDDNEFEARCLKYIDEFN